MLSFLRRLRLSYAAYNVFQHRRLVHNLPLYEKLGLKKQYFSPISSRDFAHLPPNAGLPPVPLYYLNADYQNEGTAWLIDEKPCTEYEEYIHQKIADAGIPRQIFLAQKGDVFIWHANLMHGGEPHPDKTMTRQSMVFHYFSRAHICYHEITQRPALL